MRRKPLAFLCSVGCALVVVAALVGCGTQTVIKTVTSNGQGSTPSQPSGGAAQQAKLGDTLTLRGNGGESMAVTVTQVRDPLQVGQYEEPDSGKRFVGVQITLKNVGSASYSDSPSNGATLITNTNEQAQGHQTVTGGPCGSGFQSSANIAPGDTQQGCIPFQMPIGQTPSRFQFTLSSGFADQTGQWSVADAATSTGAASSGPTSSAASGSLPQHCGPGIDTTHAISCALANNVFYEYYKATHTGGNGTTLSAWSPITKQYYSASCSTGTGVIKCMISGTTDPNAEVDLAQAALSAYTSQQANSYAANVDLGPNG